jgi:hypothetical protein
MQEAIAFRVQGREAAALEVRVNFGVFAGRNATQAEIDELARGLQEIVASFAIIAEERHEFGNDVEASARQIVIEVLPEYVDADLETLGERVVARAERWATQCIDERTELGELGSEL